MRTDDLYERGTLICGRLTEAVNRMAVEGMGRWERTWEIVDPPTAEFWDALSAWEADPNDRTADRVRSTYQIVLKMWQQAVTEYAARPTSGTHHRRN